MSEILECPICSININSGEKITLKCNHIFHRLCLLESLKIDKVRNCPYCRQSFPLLNYKDGETFIKGIHKNKIQSITKNFKYCKAILKSGSRKGTECSSIIFIDNNDLNDDTIKYYCKRHSIVKDIVL